MRHRRARPFVLVVANRWMSWNPALVSTGIDQNITGPLSALDLGPWDVWYPDADVVRTGSSLEPSAERLATYIRTVSPDLVILVRVPWEEPAWWIWLQIVTETCRRHGVAAVTLWYDLVTDGDIQLAERIAPLVDGQVHIDRHVPPCGAQDPRRYLPLWTVHDPRLFYTGTWSRPLELTCVGDWEHPERRRVRTRLEQSTIPYCLVGGQHHIVPLTEYAQACRRSQMTINTNNHPACAQLKGHLFEGLSCGALVLEQHFDSGGTQHLLVPELEYLPFRSDEELVDRIRYCQRHPTYRDGIARNGARAYHERYSPRQFWRRICEWAWPTEPV